MPHVSTKELDNKTKKQILDTFEIIIGQLNKNETNTFLYSLLSETERIMIAKRLAIAILLKEGIDHTAVAETFNVTRETVGRIHLSTILKAKGFDLAISKLKKDKIAAELKKALVGFAKYSVNAAGGRVKI